jgi:DNA adenine methylase
VATFDPFAPLPLPEDALKPPLKWAGGKRWLVPHLRPLWEEYKERRLVEPFAGGLAVTLGLMPQEALLNDISPYLMNFYRWVKEDGTLRPGRWGVPGFKLRGKEPPTEEEYYALRDRFNELLRSRGPRGPVQAQLFYYLNRTGFNGLCRFNSTGEFNVPRGAYTTITYRHDFSEYHEVFRRWEFQIGDFKKLKGQLRDDDFIYCDSPYDTPFTKYSPEDFKWDDQVDLALWAVSHPGPVIVSNQATDRMIELYRMCGFELRFLDAPRRISRTGDRTPAKEILAFHNVPLEHIALVEHAWLEPYGDHSLEDPETQRGFKRVRRKLGL